MTTPLDSRSAPLSPSGMTREIDRAAQDEVLPVPRMRSTPASLCVTPLTGWARAGGSRTRGRSSERTDQISYGRGPDSPGLVQHCPICPRRPLFSIPARVCRSGRSISPPLFPMALIEQEVSSGRQIEIPEPVQHLPHVAADAPLPGPPPGADPQHTAPASTINTRV